MIRVGKRSMSDAIWSISGIAHKASQRPQLRMQMKIASKGSGFSLTELLVALAILGILAAMAAPSLVNYVIKSQIQSLGNEFSASVMRARSEAVGKNTCVTLCMSSTVDAIGGAGTSTGPRCATSGQDWGVGWIAFLNPSCTSSLNFPASADDMIFYKRRAEPDYFLQAQSNTRKIFFNARGNPRLGDADEFDLVYRTSNDPFTSKFAFNICLDALGRTRNVSATSSCSQP